MIRLTMRGLRAAVQQRFDQPRETFLCLDDFRNGRGLLYFSDDYSGRIAVKAHQIRIADKASDPAVGVAQSQMVNAHLLHFKNRLEDGALHPGAK